MRTKIKLQGMTSEGVMYYYDKECRKSRLNPRNAGNWVPIVFSALSHNIYTSAKAEAPPCGVRILLRDISDLFIIRLPLPYK